MHPKKKKKKKRRILHFCPFCSALHPCKFTFSQSCQGSTLLTQFYFSRGSNKQELISPWKALNRMKTVSIQLFKINWSTNSSLSKLKNTAKYQTMNKWHLSTHPGMTNTELIENIKPTPLQIQSCILMVGIWHGGYASPAWRIGPKSPTLSESPTLYWAEICTMSERKPSHYSETNHSLPPVYCVQFYPTSAT